MSKTDLIDERLIELLSEDARQSSERLAKRLSISAATARRRLARLLQSGTLRIIAIGDPFETGLPIVVMIGIKVDPDKVDGVLKAMSQRPRCTWVSSTTGRFDVQAIERFRSTDELSDFIQKDLPKVPGIRGVETSICLHVEKALFRRA